MPSSSDITLGIILTADVTDLVDGLQSASDSGKEVGESLVESFEDVSDSVEDVGSDIVKSLQLGSIQETVDAFNETMQGMVDSISATANEFLKFDSAIKELSTLVDSSVTSNDMLVKSVTDLSVEFGADTTETAKAMYQAISAGASAGEQANELMSVAIKTASGGVTDAKTAVDGLTTVINAYGMNMSKAGDVADTMFLTMRNGKTTIGELSAYYSSAIPMSSALGISFEELSASIIGMTAQGKTTGPTLTAISQTMSSLVAPSDELTAIFKDLGFSSAEAAIRQNGFGFALNALNDATGGSVSQLGKLLGSATAVSTVVSLAGDKSHFLTDAMGKMANKAGALDEAFSKMDESPMEQIGGELTKIQVVVLKIGEQVVAAFLPFLQVVGSVFEKVKQLADQFPKLFAFITQGVTIFAGFALVLGSGVGILAAIQSAWLALVPVVMNFGTAIVAAGGAMKGFMVWMAQTSVVGVWNTVLVALTGAWSTLTTVISTSSAAVKGFLISFGPIGLAIAAVVAGYAALSHYASKSAEDLELSHQKLKETLTTAKNFNDVIAKLRDSKVVGDDVIQEVEQVKAAVMSGRMTEADGMKIANEYVQQIERRAKVEETIVKELDVKKAEIIELEKQRLSALLEYRLKVADESAKSSQSQVTAEYDAAIANVNDELAKNIQLEKDRGGSVDQIAKIQAKASNDILTIESERSTKTIKIAEDLFNKKKAIIEEEAKNSPKAAQEAGEKILTIEKELAQTRIDVSKKAYDEIDKRLQESVKQAEEYANKVKSLDQSIADEKLSTEDKIAQVRRRGMDEQQTQAAITQQLAQRQAQLSGAFKAGDIEGAKNYTDSLIAVSKESQDTDQSLRSLNIAANEALKAGNTEEAKKLANAMSEIGGKVEDNAKAEGALQVASNIRVAAMEKEKASAMEAQKIAEERIAKEEQLKEAQRVAMEENTAALQKITEGGESKLTISVQYDEAKAAIEELETKLTNLRDTKIGVSIESSQDQGQLEFLENVRQGHENNLKTIKATAEATRKLGDESANLKLEMETKAAQTALAGIEEKINNLKNSTINVDVKTTESKAGGGVIGMAMGDVVPGVGDSDSVPAMLTPGEYVVRKARSIQFRDLLNAINYGSDDLLSKLVTLPQFNLGGFVNMPSFNLPTLRLESGGFIPAMPPSAPQMPSETIRIDFSMGNQSGSLLASPAAEARKFAAMLREMKRG